MSNTPDSADMVAFECRMCGHCCFGEGGIVLSDHDLERLATHMDMTSEAFLTKYGEHRNGKRYLQVRADKYCIFFSDEVSGCGIHLARPDICRAWPFFRGNLIDEESWAMIQEDCKGVNPDVPHEEFARQGREYLKSHGLVDERGTGPANALKK